jgi:hypothetical protein
LYFADVFDVARFLMVTGHNTKKVERKKKRKKREKQKKKNETAFSTSVGTGTDE